MAIGKIVVYKDLEDIFVLCMREVISSTCEKAWGGTEEGAFGTFKKHDIENTNTVNAEIDNRRKEAEEKLKKEEQENKEKGKKVKVKKINPDDYKHIVAIASKAKSFKKFDFQACNNTLAHLEPVYKKIFHQYKLNDSQSENCITTAKELIRLRNRLAHPDPNDPPSKVVEYQKSCINYMNFMFGLGFSAVVDENGVTYYEQFQKKYIQYMEQELQRWYHLSDFLDLKHYDASRFLEVCATNNIVADKKDAKYLFRTSNLEETVEILKNNLAINGDNIALRAPDAPSAVQKPEAAPQPIKKNNKLIYVAVAVICALVLGGIILATTVIPALTGLFRGNVKNPLSSEPASQSSTIENGGSSSTIVENSGSSDKAENSEKNQVLPEHEGQVQALQYADRLTLENQTLKVGVGGYVSPPPASVWGNITIYSQNTDIAASEGSLVKGVAPGTTYVIIESENGTTAAYCVVVE